MKTKMNTTNVKTSFLRRGWGRLLLMLAFIGLNTANAQVGIGTTNPDASAILELEATDKGLLPPRITTAQRDAISNPAEGLMIYNTDEKCMQWYDNNGWYDGCSGPTYPLVASLDCANATNNGTLTDGEAAAGVTTEIAYTGGNGLSHSGQTVNSTGVTGLTATLAPGTLATGAGSLTYTISGTPASDGTASFAINIGGQTCSLTRTVNPPIPTVIGANDKIWMDRNLGATQVATGPKDTDAYGDLYQWGRAADGHEDRNSTKYTAVETGSDGVANFNASGNAWDGKFITRNSGAYNWVDPSVSGVDNLWQGVNGTNNPCPAGFRVPTEAEWQAEIGNWSNATDAFQSTLALSVAGSRGRSTGALGSVGSNGLYWSSTVSGTDARYLNFSSSGADMNTVDRARGFSVRCIKDE